MFCDWSAVQPSPAPRRASPRHRNSIPPLAVALAATVVLPPSPLTAQTALTWGAAGSGTPAGGSGNWDTTGAAFWTGNLGSTYQSWPGPATAAGAIFGGTAGTVTVTGNVSASSLTFNTSGYTVSSTGGNVLTLVNDPFGWLPKFIVPTAGHTATLNVPLAGTAPFNVYGSGTLAIAAANTITGGASPLAVGMTNGGTIRLLGATGSFHTDTYLQFGYDISSDAGGRGTFIYDNTGATGAISQSFLGWGAGISAYGGDAFIQTNRVAAHDVTLTFENFGFSRSASATINFLVTGGTNGVDNRITFNSQAPGFLDHGTFFNGSSFAWLDDTRYVRAINYGTDPDTATTAGGTALPDAPHVQLTGAVTAQPSATYTSLRFNGAADLTLASDATFIVNGLLKAGDASATLSGGSLTAGPDQGLVVRVDQSTDALTISSIVFNHPDGRPPGTWYPEDPGGVTSLTKSGDGTLTLTGTNTFSGTVFINSGTLAVPTLPNNGVTGPLGTGAVTLAGGTLRYTGATATSDRTIAVFGGGIEISNSATTLTLNSGISGPTLNLPGDFLVKSGPGTLALTGTADNSGLSVRVAAGTLQLAKSSGDFTHATGNLTVENGAAARLTGTGNDQIYDPSTVTVAAGGTLDFNGRNETFGALSGSGSLTNTSSSAHSTATIGFDGASGTFSGVISNGASRTLALTKTGSGTQILSGANTFSGATTISGGTLRIEHSLALQSSTLTAPNGASAFFSFGPLTAATFGGLTGSNALALTNASATAVALTLGNNNASTTYSGALGGGGSIAKVGSGTLTLSGSSNFTGGVSIQAGTVRASNANALGTGTSAVTLAGGTLELAGANLTFSRNTTLAANATLVSDRAASSTSNTTHTLGTLGLGTHTLTVNKGSNVTGSGIGAVTFGATTLSGNPTLAIGTNATLTLGALADGATARTLTKSGAGNLTLGTAASSLVDGTALDLAAGRLNLNHATALGSLANITLSTGTTLALGASPTFGALNGSGGTVTLGGNTLTIGHATNNLTSAYAGTISGTGFLAKAGTGSLTFSAANSYSGATTISAGTLVAAANAALGTTASGTTVASGATLAFSGGFNYTTAESVTLSGTGAAGRNGALHNLAGNNSFAGALTLAADVQVGAASSTQLTLSGAISETGGARALTYAGDGTIVRTGAASHTGGTTISSGTVTVNSGSLSAASAPLTLSGGTLNLNLIAQTISRLSGSAGTLNLGPGHTLTVNQSAASSFTGSLAGAGGLTKSGTGSLTLGNASYSGATLVNGGLLNLAGSIGALTIASGGTFSPGNSPGTTSGTSATWAGGGSFLIELNNAAGVAGTHWDLLSLSGVLAITATPADKFTLALASLTPANAAGPAANFNPAASYTFDFLTATGGISGFNTSAFALDTSGFQNTFSGTWSLSATANTLSLNYSASAIPEPGAYAAFAGVATLLAAFWRRRPRPPARAARP